MKRIYLLLILILCAGISSAEVVSAITFNPSRLGTYTYLRAANSAVLAGGLETETMNVSSAGTVSVTTPSSDNIYVATEVRPVENASLVTVNMPNTAFYGKSDSVGGLSSITTVAIAGGTQTYQKKSYVHLLDAASSLIQQVNTLKGGALTISGNAKDGRNLYYGTHSNGFYLAGNDIPEPVAAYTNGAGDLTGCKWAWVDRQGAKVLALDDCKKSSTPSSQKICTWGDKNYEQALVSPDDYPGATIVQDNPKGKSCSSSEEGNFVLLTLQVSPLILYGPIVCECYVP
ncbi:MAG: hypothetical protein PUK74_00265 [Elusimicrobia bacterium]|nr:hypothetical protein [Elusimicrobiota bacterium]MDY5728879.1 hypothetical protein [Elusimicrobiaceae bacterium]